MDNNWSATGMHPLPSSISDSHKLHKLINTRTRFWYTMEQPNMTEGSRLFQQHRFIGWELRRPAAPHNRFRSKCSERWTRHRKNKRQQSRHTDQINQTGIETVDHFTYLGSTIRNDGNTTVSINCRIRKAAPVFERMCQVWSSTTISIHMKLRLYSTVVLLTAL